MTIVNRPVKQAWLLTALCIASCSSPPGAGTLRPGAVGLGGGSLIANNAGGLIANNAGGLISNNASGLTGVVRGPAAGLIANNASGLIANNAGGLVANNAGGLIANNAGGLIANNAGGLIANNAGGYFVLDADELTHPVGNAVVTLVDAFGAPVGNASATTDAGGSFVMNVVGLEKTPKTPIFLKATFEQDGRTVTLLCAAPPFEDGKVLESPLDPATSIVAKKAAEAVAQGTIKAEDLDSETIVTLTRQVRAVLTARSAVAAVLEAPGFGGHVLDAMVAESPDLSNALNGTTKDKALVAIVSGPGATGGGSAGAQGGVGVASVAGGGVSGSADGEGAAARFNLPYSLAAAPGGGLYVSEFGNHRIRRVSFAANGTPSVVTFAGGEVGYKDAAGSTARFSAPRGIASDAAGNLFVADAGNNRIRKVAPDGTVTTFAGSGIAGLADGSAASARFNSPRGLALDEDGNLYVADTQNFCVRMIDTSGNVTTLAGINERGYVDGMGVDARFDGPLALAVGSGKLYVADYYGHRVRTIALGAGDHVVKTLAGDGKAGAADGGSGRLNFPASLALDAAGTLWVADSGNNAIRRITADGELSTLDLGTPSTLNGPYGLLLTAKGDLFTADTSNHRICKLAH